MPRNRRPGRGKVLRVIPERFCEWRRALPPASVLATLAHSWAHLLAWAEGAAGPDHGPRWRELHAEARWALGLDR